MDKKVSSITAPIAFVDGESLTAAKLNAAFRNLYRGISDLESLIGDPRDSAAPYGEAAQLSQATFTEEEAEIAAGKDLNIINLARLIGPAEALNPHHLKDTSYQLTETLPSSGRKFKLKYRNIKIGSISTDDSALTNLVHLSGANADTAGDWWVEREAGIVHSIDEFTGGNISYEIDEESVDQLENYYEASFNVMPDPNQSTKCTVALDDPGIPSYLLELPVITDQQRNEDNDSTQLNQEYGDLNFQKQLKLPFVLRGLSVGDDIPLNFLAVKNLTTNRYLSGVTYTYAGESSFLIKGAVLDEGHEYQVVTVGTSITETIKDINRKLTALRMGRAGRDLVLASKIVNDLDGFPNSTRPSNVLPQYLHRDGADYTPPDDPELITNDRGGMRGTFLMLANQKVDGTYYNLNYDSREIRFGTLSGPSIKNKAVVPGVPSNNYLKMTPGADAASVRVMDGYFGAEDGIKAGLTGYNGPFKWAKITYNGALTGGSSDQIAIDVATTLGITVDKILSVTGGLYLASISSFFYLNCNDPSNVIFKDHFLYPDANFVVTLSATYATMYSAASSSNRQFKLFVHYED